MAFTDDANMGVHAENGNQSRETDLSHPDGGGSVVSPEERAELEAIQAEEVAANAAPDGEHVPEPDAADEGDEFIPGWAADIFSDRGADLSKATPAASISTPANASERTHGSEEAVEDKVAKDDDPSPNLLNAEARALGAPDRTLVRKRFFPEFVPHPDRPKAKAIHNRSLRRHIGALTEQRMEVLARKRKSPIDDNVLPPRIRFVERAPTKNFIPNGDTVDTDFPFPLGHPSPKLPAPKIQELEFRDGRGEYMQLTPDWLTVADADGKPHPTWLGFPFGKWGRILLFYAISEAYRCKSGEIDFFDGRVERFLDAINEERYGGDNGPYRLVKTNLARWACTHLDFTRTQPYKASTSSLRLFKNVPIGVSVDDKGRFQFDTPDHLVLNEDLLSDPWGIFAPVDFDALQAMHGSTAMDALIFFSNYLPHLQRSGASAPSFMTWKDIRDRFYTPSYKPNHVEKRFRRIMQQIWEVWPNTQDTVRYCKDGIEMERTAPMVPWKGQVEAHHRRLKRSGRKAGGPFA